MLCLASVKQLADELLIGQLFRLMDLQKKNNIILLLFFFSKALLVGILHMVL